MQPALQSAQSPADMIDFPDMDVSSEDDAQVQPTSQLAALKPSPACIIIPTRPSPFQDITNVSSKRKHEEVRETTVVVRNEAENTASMATQLTKQQAYFQEMLLKQQLN